MTLAISKSELGYAAPNLPLLLKKNSKDLIDLMCTEVGAFLVEVTVKTTYRKC